ncbi:type II secretion system protein [bacterium]|nr:type II secretion system protein [bacterium]
MKNKKQAFTLAEVLLVLAIIGVIAAVTIPAIMQQSSEKKFAALAKKAQSTIQNAIDLKIAMVPIGPAEYNNRIFAWLADGEDNGTNTLKAAKISNDSNVIQTADGMILYQDATFTGRGDKLGIMPCVYIDLNGADPPTRTTVTDLSALQRTDNGKAYDVIFVTIQANGNVEPGYTGVSGGYSISKRRDRARKYLNL